MTVDSLRSAVLFLFDPFVNVFHAHKISANTLSDAGASIRDAGRRRILFLVRQ